MNSKTSAATLNVAKIKPDSWKQFAHTWTPETQRSQFATKVLRLPVKQAYDFAKNNTDPELDAAAKRWHSQLRLETSHLPDQAVLNKLKSICQIEDFTQLNSAVAAALKVFKETPDYNKFINASWALTTSGMPQAGIIIGLALLEPDSPVPQFSRPLHPKDGNALVRQGLRMMEENKALSKKFGTWVSELRQTFKVTELKNNTGLFDRLRKTKDRVVASIKSWFAEKFS